MKKIFIPLRYAFNGVRNQFSKLSLRMNMALLMLLGALTANAQDASGADPEAGAAALSDVTVYIWKYLPVVQNIVYALGAVVFMSGIYTVAHAFQNGDQDAKGKAVALIGGSIVLIIGVTVLPKMFGYAG